MGKIKDRLAKMAMVLFLLLCLTMVAFVILAPLLYFESVGYGIEAFTVYIILFMLGVAWLLSKE